jgi:hypothetical protein
MIANPPRVNNDWSGTRKDSSCRNASSISFAFGRKDMTMSLISCGSDVRHKSLEILMIQQSVEPYIPQKLGLDARIF